MPFSDGFGIVTAGANQTEALRESVTLLELQRLEQYLTCGQSFFHFRRQLNGRSHTGQTLLSSQNLVFIGDPSPVPGARITFTGSDNP